MATRKRNTLEELKESLTGHKQLQAMKKPSITLV